MTNMESRNHAKSFLQKAQEYLDSAQDDLDLERATAAVGEILPVAPLNSTARPSSPLVLGRRGACGECSDYCVCFEYRE